jgi:surfactin synthase thioesterase subunit
MHVSLLCLPCAGASASMYLRWQRLLPPWIRVVPVELPGRGARFAEAFIEDFDQLVEHLCETYVRHADVRYALYGHSMGALVAYGMAMRWRKLSLRLPDVLFASASPAPVHREPEYFLDKQTDAALIADLHKQGGTPLELFESEEMLRITLDTLRADYRVCSGFRYSAVQSLAVPIHVFAGRQDDIAPERIFAWEAETSASFSVRWFEGGHFFIREHEPEIADAITRHLRKEPSGYARADAAFSASAKISKT